MAERITYGGNYREGADEKLIDILTRAASAQGMQVEFTSGYRPGDKRQHGKKNALDITLIKDGQRLPNYQNAEHFRTYEKFAQTARQIQRAQYPELDSKFRWGGYFSGPKGKYGAVDTMHFDLAGDRLGMGGGSWERGLTKRQRQLFPGVQSVGFNDHPMPKANIPELGVASALSTAPTPQIISASLGNARSNPPPLPARRPTPPQTTATLPTFDRMPPEFAGGFLGRPSSPASRALVAGAVESIGNQPIRNSGHYPNSAGTAVQAPRFTAPQPAGGAPTRRVASVPITGNSFAGTPTRYWPGRGEALEQRPLVPPSLSPIAPMSAPPRAAMREPANPPRVASLGPISAPYGLAPTGPIPASAEQRTTARNRYALAQPTPPQSAPPPPAQPAPLPMPHTGAVKARANNQMAALPMTEAEQMFQASQFGMPPLPIPRPQLPPVPMPAFMRPQMPQGRVPLQITVPGGRRIAPVPMPASARPSSNTIYNNPTKYGSTSSARKASAAKRRALENFSSYGSSGGGFDGSGGGGSLVG